tara:strand:+ start:608 stop:1033 length:426 start_codon:yes stop_codon:yes gene_type:complete
MKKILLIVICLVSFNVIVANQSESYTIEKIISVYDGDTFRADIKGLPDIIGKNIAIRILGIDTPEIKGKCKKEKIIAIKAREFTRKSLFNAKTITLKNLKRDKYFRLLADVYYDDTDLANALLVNNLAVKYSGKKKSSWCK